MPTLECQINTDGSIASIILNPYHLTQLMYKATMNDIWIKEGSEVDLWGKIDKLDRRAHEQLNLLDKLNLIAPRKPSPIRKCFVITSCLTLKLGSICNCGKLI